MSKVARLPRPPKPYSRGQYARQWVVSQSKRRQIGEGEAARPPAAWPCVGVACALDPGGVGGCGARPQGAPLGPAPRSPRAQLRQLGLGRGAAVGVVVAAAAAAVGSWRRRDVAAQACEPCVRAALAGQHTVAARWCPAALPGAMADYRARGWGAIELELWALALAGGGCAAAPVPSHWPLAIFLYFARGAGADATLSV